MFICILILQVITYVLTIILYIWQYWCLFFTLFIISWSFFLTPLLLIFPRYLNLYTLQILLFTLKFPSLAIFLKDPHCLALLVITRISSNNFSNHYISLPIWGEKIWPEPGLEPHKVCFYLDVIFGFALQQMTT